MKSRTRREFVQSSAAAAAGMTVLGALYTSQADADVVNQASPVVACVRNARTGEISLMSGDRTVSVHDKQLAARLARAATQGN